ncbi:adhesin-like protein [Planoprotostelium fungivorum]|uniref:Adhesin-like protein n=1 Tax=Planoprotostelium fungivorum TaxID=1890364 RepID=A0A2P6NDR6_9EUKA|nr:adhesin-like protein [Planoprotostelium fungivorum]
MVSADRRRAENHIEVEMKGRDTVRAVIILSSFSKSFSKQYLVVFGSNISLEVEHTEKPLKGVKKYKPLMRNPIVVLLSISLYSIYAAVCDVQTSGYSGSINNAWNNAPSTGCTGFNLIVDSYTSESTSLSARGQMTLQLSTLNPNNTVITGSITFSSIPQVAISNVLFSGSTVSFTEVPNVTISDSTFSTSPVITSASTTNTFIISRSMLQFNTGSAIKVINGALTVDSCTFSFNTQRAIYHTNTPTPPLVIINSTFFNNSFSDYGATVWAGYNITITDSRFSFNSGTRGGAVYSNAGSVSCLRCLFDTNSASDNGGCVWANNNIDLDSSTVVRSISTQGRAGGLYANLGTVRTFNCILSNNTALGDGGAIWSNSDAFLGHTTLQGNQGQQGGAIYGNARVFLNSTQLILNSGASNGGAVYCQGDAFVSDTIISSNKVKNGNGGAIYGRGRVQMSGGEYKNNYITMAIGQGGVVWSQSDMTIMNARFENNTASSGGALFSGSSVTTNNSLYIAHTATDTAGAIYSTTDATIYNSTFLNNTGSLGAGGAVHSDVGAVKSVASVYDNNAAKGSGGAIYAKLDVHSEDLTISNNRADSGGGLYSYQGNVYVLRTWFYDNEASAPGRGGAISGGNISVDGARFLGNSASQGGAIYCAGDTLQLNDTDILYNNATGLGGGIYMAGSTLTIYNERLSNISYNTAGQSGGAIYAPNANVTIEWAEFIGNSAPSSDGNGGAMEAASVEISNSLFQENAAGGLGGALYTSGSLGLIASITSFRDNTAGRMGGCVYSSGAVVLSGSNFIRCKGGSVGGGGIYGNAVSVIRSYFAHNDAPSGGGIYSSAGVIAEASVFSYNNGSDGGAIYAAGSSSLVNCDFRNNTANSYPSYDIPATSNLRSVTLFPCDSSSTQHGNSALTCSTAPAFDPTSDLHYPIRGAIVYSVQYARGNITIYGRYLDAPSVPVSLRFQGQQISSYTRSDVTITFKSSLLKADNANVTVILGSLVSQLSVTFDAFEAQTQDFLNTLYDLLPNLANYMLNGSVTFSSDRLNLTAVTLQQNITAEISTHLGGVTLPPGVIEPQSLTNGSYLLYYTTREIPAEFETNVTTFVAVAGVSLYHANGTEISVKDTETPVVIQFNLDRENNSLICGFWDESLLRWSTEGCNTTYSSLVYKCYCNHLTNFTLISRGNGNGNGGQVNTGSGEDSTVSNTSGPKNNLGIIIGAVVGGCLLILLVVIVIVILYKRKMQADANDIKMNSVSELAGKISYKSQIHQGKYSAVWEGFYLDTNRVAIKVAKDEYRTKLMEEAISLKSFHHPNIVMYLNQEFSTEVSCVVMEWMNSGNLHTYMKGNTLSSDMTHLIGSQISTALSYLEDNNVVHNQICPKKILLSIEGSVILAKLCGFSRCVSTGRLSSKEDRSAYSSPEAVKELPITPASDTWSFGMLLWRIVSGVEPYQQEQKMYQQIAKGVVPQIEPHWNQTIRSIIEECCRESPKERLTPRAIVIRFQMNGYKPGTRVHDLSEGPDPYASLV